MNPFLKEELTTISYTDSFKSQIKNLEIGDTLKLNTHRKNNIEARPIIFYAANKLGFEIKTRADQESNLWIIRTK